MPIRSSRYLVAFIGLLVFLLSGQAGVQGYVLCVSESGRIDLETSLDGSCGSKSEKKRHCDTSDSEFTTPFPEENCGPCLDIPATNEITSRAYKLKNTTFPPASEPITFRVLTSNVSAQTTPVSSPAEISPWVRQTITNLRTVVLLN